MVAALARRADPEQDREADAVGGPRITRRDDERAYRQLTPAWQENLSPEELAREQ